MITAAQPQASADKASLEDRIAEGVARCGAVVTYPWVARSLRHGCLLWKAVVADRGDATDSCVDQLGSAEHQIGAGTQQVRRAPSARTLPRSLRHLTGS